MRKSFFCFIIFVLLCSSLFSQNSTNEDVYENNFLCESKWVRYSYNSYIFFFSFSPEGTYKTYYGPEGGGLSVSGNYEVKGNKVILHIETIYFKSSWDSDLYYQDESIWEIVKLDSDPVFQFALKSTKTDELNYKYASPLLSNLKRKIGQFEIITCGLKKAITIDNVKLRKGPGVKYEFELVNLDGIEGDLSYLPVGRYVYLVGRSMNKDFANNSLDYWFYCIPDLGVYDSGPQFAWIHGSLLSMQDN